MRIREQECENNICLSKFKFNCDEVDKKIPKPLPQNLNHFLLIVGKPGSSKTTLILNLIAKRGKNYNKRFDRVYLWSPSLCTIDDCPFEELPDDQKFEDLTEANLQGVLDDIKDSSEHILFIMDDVVNDMKKEFYLEKLLCKVLMNRRHQCGSGGGLSVWITSQVYNKVPAPVRKCASQLILYETFNRMELDSVYSNAIVGMKKDEWYQLLKYVWDKKFNFLYLDTTKSFNQMYHKNFNSLHLTTEMDDKYSTDWHS
eukprot:COSAG01_NODE_2882_length_6914_cov_40.714894_4_plen_257_part_00